MRTSVPFPLRSFVNVWTQQWLRLSTQCGWKSSWWSSWKPRSGTLRCSSASSKVRERLGGGGKDRQTVWRFCVDWERLSQGPVPTVFKRLEVGMVVHALNPWIQRGRGQEDIYDFEDSQGYIVRSYLLKSSFFWIFTIWIYTLVSAIQISPPI